MKVERVVYSAYCICLKVHLCNMNDSKNVGLKFGNVQIENV